MLAGPASREDRKQMYELLTRSRVIEVRKLHDHLIMWKFASERLTKYGFNRPEATMLFDTLKVSCEKLAEKDGEFKFQLQSFVKEHSSVNGLVTMDTVKSLYDMILDNARSYLPGKIEQDNAKVDKISIDGCYICGSREHWRRECPQATGQHGKGKTKSLSKDQGKGKPPGIQPLGAGKGKGQKGQEES